MRTLVCCYLGLLVLYGHFLAPLYQIQTLFHISAMPAAAYFFRAGEKLAQQLPLGTACLARGELTASSSCSNGELLPGTPFQTCRHTHSAPGSHLPAPKPLSWGISTTFWWQEIPQFLSLDKFPLLYE